MVIVVGGPQYRVGGHRLFVTIARDLSARGVAVLRFDCRGMGDSEGTFPGFTTIETDIEAAINALVRAVPSVTRITLWALCDGASAICLYAYKDRRVSGVALINPWVRTEAIQARAYLKHYYWRRLTDPSFLHKLAAGEFNFVQAGRSLLANLVHALRRGPEGHSGEAAQQVSLPERMANGIRRFEGPVLIVVAGRDLTAREFDDATRSSKAWREILNSTRVRRHSLGAADHTFSRRVWRDQLTAWTWEWLVEISDFQREQMKN